MAKYKKSKLRKFMQDMGYPVPALKDCFYESIRGSECLRFSILGNDESEADYEYKIRVSGQSVRIEKTDYSDIFSPRCVEKQIVPFNEFIMLIG